MGPPSPHITEGRSVWLELPHLAQASLKACEVSLESISLRKQKQRHLKGKLCFLGSASKDKE